ncbi:hypothetical protein ACB098_11G052300 [Castanea mollissima]
MPSNVTSRRKIVVSNWEKSVDNSRSFLPPPPPKTKIFVLILLYNKEVVVQSHTKSNNKLDALISVISQILTVEVGCATSNRTYMRKLTETLGSRVFFTLYFGSTYKKHNLI